MLDSGVYLIRNVLNGKRYVGSAAKGFSKRWQDPAYRERMVSVRRSRRKVEVLDAKPV